MQAEKVVAFWIHQLTRLTTDQVEELGPVEFQHYQAEMNRILGRILDRPSKKR